MEKLKENDLKLLGFCRDIKRSINEISRFMEMSPASVCSRVNKLKEKDLIQVNKQGLGKKTYVRTKGGDKVKEHYVTILKEIKKRKGVTDEEYPHILPFNRYDPKENDRLKAMLSLPWKQPKLIFKKIFITPEGEKFLKENA